MVPLNRLGDLLQKNGLTTSWWSHNQSPLPFTERSHEINYPRREPGSIIPAFENEALLGEERGQIIKVFLRLIFSGRLSIDLKHSCWFVPPLSPSFGCVIVRFDIALVLCPGVRWNSSPRSWIGTAR